MTVFVLDTKMTKLDHDRRAANDGKVDLRHGVESGHYGLAEAGAHFVTVLVIRRADHRNNNADAQADEKCKQRYFKRDKQAVGDVLPAVALNEVEYKGLLNLIEP